MQKASSYPLPRVTDREWSEIQRNIPLPKRGPAPRHDREIVSRLAYSIAARCSYESLPKDYPAAAIRLRVQRWQKIGALPSIMAAMAPAVERIETNYWAHLRRISLGKDWKMHREKDDPELVNLPRQTHCR